MKVSAESSESDLSWNIGDMTGNISNISLASLETDLRLKHWKNISSVKIQTILQQSNDLTFDLPSFSDSSDVERNSLKLMDSEKLIIDNQ